MTSRFMLTGLPRCHAGVYSRCRLGRRPVWQPMAPYGFDGAQHVVCANSTNSRGTQVIGGSIRG